MPDPAVAPFAGERPLAAAERRIVTHMLVMAACEFCTPVILVVLIESDYLLLHSPRRVLWNGGFRAAGFHQRNIVSAMDQQTPDAITSGISCL